MKRSELSPCAPVFAILSGKLFSFFRIAGPAMWLVACSEREGSETGASDDEDHRGLAYSEMSDSEFAALGDEVTTQLAANLMAQLETAISTGGPAMAVEICQSVAQPMTRATAGDFAGLSVRRTALRVRNPENAPDEIDRTVLERWADARPTGDDERPAHEVVRTEDGGRIYYRPIVMQPLCVTCHGPEDALSPAVKPGIAKHYPEDEAVGFQPGDLRGVFRVGIVSD